MIQTIFGSPVVVINSDSPELFPNDLYNEIVDYLMSPENKDVDHPYTRGGKICTTDLNSTIKEKIDRVGSLLDFLKQIGLKYAHLYSDKHITDLKFDNMWINITFQGCEIKNHYDRYDEFTEKTLIILFYPKAPTGGSNLVFMHNSEYGDWPSEQSESNLVKIRIESGDIVIMDNHVLHGVDTHNTPEPRMCVATEFKIETN